MKPINFEGANVQIAKDQEEYMTLPALYDPVVGGNQVGQVTCVWKPDNEERKAIAKGANIGLSIWTFNGPLQPLSMFATTAKEIPDEEG